MHGHHARIYVPTIRMDGTCITPSERAREIRRVEELVLDRQLGTGGFIRYTGVMRGSVESGRHTRQMVDLLEFRIPMAVDATGIAEDISRRLDVGPVELELDGTTFFCLGTEQEGGINDGN